MEENSKSTFEGGNPRYPMVPSVKFKIFNYSIRVQMVQR